MFYGNYSTRPAVKPVCGGFPASAGALFRLVGGGIIVLTFAFWQIFGICVRRWFPRAARRWANRVTSLGCRAYLRHWGITVTLRNARHMAPRRTYLYAVNHLSYLDVLVHGALFPSTFITSREMRGTPFLGHICRFAQCFFVDRKNRRRLAQEIRAVAALLESGVPVTLFPEGAAGDGAGVQPFKSPLFKACALAGVPVLPLTLNYRTLDSVPVGSANRDDVCWYGRMAFFPHVWRLLHHRRIEVDVVVAPPLVGGDYRELAEKTREAVAGGYAPLVAPPRVGRRGGADGPAPGKPARWRAWTRSGSV